MNQITFVTGNDRKMKEAVDGCALHNIEVLQAKINIDEIQSHDPLEIAHDKAQKAFNMLKKPIIISDTSWNIPSLNGFPGGYMKDIATWFTPKDFLSLMKDKQDQRVCFIESLVYQDSSQQKVFSKQYWGVFTSTPKGSGNSIEQVAEFDGFTLGERRDQGKNSHAPENYIWVDFAKWFSAMIK